ncbi:MAG: replication-relaxation family protein, partial [Chloroflexota bacterium]|nr:replication-relaxation family protein [Chloroflexota bacterium]
RQGGRLPRLVIATDEQRLDAWRGLLEEVADRRREALLDAHVVDWHTVRTMGLDGLGAETGGPVSGPFDTLAVDAGRPPLPANPRVDANLSRQIAEGAFHKAAALYKVARATTPTDRKVLWHLSRHPLLTRDQLARILGVSPDHMRRRIHHLVEGHFLRLVEEIEVGPAAADGLLEVTVTGLALVAAAMGLPPAAAVRFQGLAGGGPDKPFGARRNLVRNVAHTTGVNRLIASLGPIAWDLKTDGLIGWDGASASSRGGTQPDAYCLCRYNGQQLGFFLEYDRGTMGQKHYLHKLDCYYRYRDNRRFERDYYGYPAILFVTTDNAAEDRFAQAARSAAQGRGAELPVLLTCEWRVYDPRNRDGLFGAIWRRAAEPFECRHEWPDDFIRTSTRSA